MRKTLIGLSAAAAILAATAANAQQTVKVGIILPYSGQFADAATQMDNAIKLYVKQHGDIVSVQAALASPFGEIVMSRRSP